MKNKLTYDAGWAELRKHYRKEVKRVLKDLENGQVEEVDLARLNNFCFVSLALMGKVNQATWRKAEDMAELTDFLTGGEDAKFEGNENNSGDTDTGNAGLLAGASSVDDVPANDCAHDSGTGVESSARHSAKLPQH